jgi:prophage regulatory protein
MLHGGFVTFLQGKSMANSVAATLKTAPILKCDRQLLRCEQVQFLTGVPRSTLYKLISIGDFPAPIKLTSRAVAWPSDAVNAWIESRIAATAAII